MREIKLDVESFTGNGTAHVHLHINGKDVGFLYLSEDEREVLLESLTLGGNNVSELNITCPQEETPDDIDLDVFD